MTSCIESKKIRKALFQTGIDFHVNKYGKYGMICKKGKFRYLKQRSKGWIFLLDGPHIKTHGFHHILPQHLDQAAALPEHVHRTDYSKG